jgi:hypothetical protein
MEIKDLEYCEKITDAEMIIGGIATTTDIQTYIEPGYVDMLATASAVGDNAKTFTKTDTIVKNNLRGLTIVKATGIAFASAMDDQGFSQSFQKQTVIFITNRK